MTLRVGSFGAPFSNESTFMTTTYDFDVDTGAIADYTLTAGADEAIMVRLVAVKTETAPTSGGACLLTLETSATADAFLNSEPIASFTLAGVFNLDTSTTGSDAGFIKLAADTTLQFSVEAETLLTGKMHFVWEIMKF